LTIYSENSAVNSVITQVTPQRVGLVSEHIQFKQRWFILIYLKFTSVFQLQDSEM